MLSSHCKIMLLLGGSESYHMARSVWFSDIVAGLKIEVALIKQYKDNKSFFVVKVEAIDS